MPKTRREIIKDWNGSKKYLDYYCCSNCRDILKLYSDDSLRCVNPECSHQDMTVGFLENGCLVKEREK